MSEHQGRLISGEVTCSCGWTSGHFALASDATDLFDKHLRNVQDQWQQLDQDPAASAQMIEWYAPQTAKALRAVQADSRREFVELAISLRCGYCGAKPGERCFKPSGRATTVHAERLHAAHVQANQEGETVSD